MKQPSIFKGKHVHPLWPVFDVAPKTLRHGVIHLFAVPVINFTTQYASKPARMQVPYPHVPYPYVPYPHAPYVFSAVGAGLMLTSIGCALYNPGGTDWNTCFLLTALSIFISLAFQLVNMEALHLDQSESAPKDQ
jgi:hypothetical protein